MSERVPITEDFADLGQKLKQLEAEKEKLLQAPLPDVQPTYQYDDCTDFYG
jgi:hypothetical protein